MRKAKLAAKSEKSVGTFFNDETPADKSISTFAESANLSLLEEKSFLGEDKFWTKFLKQIFLFLPGTFLLFFTSYGAAIIAMEIFVYRRAVDALPSDYPFQIALVGSIILLGIFMTWFGLGSIKNRKHFVIPASLMATGTAIGALVKATAGVSDLADKMLDDFAYLICLLPLALIVPILAKGIVDRRSD